MSFRACAPRRPYRLANHRPPKPADRAVAIKDRPFEPRWAAPAGSWGTVIILGSGPSLTQADVDYCYGKGRVIAINDTYKLAPWADALYACDGRWWHWHKGAPTFKGARFSLDERIRRYWPDIVTFRNTGETGLELDRSALRTGKNSGYQAINLAVHFGARKIVLLGFDMCAGKDGRTHFFGEHPNRVPPPFSSMIRHFNTIVAPLAALGVEVLNCTRHTALTCFPRVPLEEALASEGAQRAEATA